ncbi:MAG: outer membrane protein assembly factor BamB [Pseudomonadota bacterium]|nr:outer membrane protein assembly factor BamB [Pseudomonadota bacterium]
MLAGCSVWNSLFSAEKPKPKELEPIVAPITVRPVWSQNIGAVQFPLTVAVNGNVLTLAAGDGSVLAVEADSGKALWRASVGAKISAGVGSDGSVAAVVTRDGDLVALEGGRVKWKKGVGVRVATAPLVAGGRIFVLGVDRTVQAFDASDGIKLWQVQRPGDALTLSQTGVIAAFKNTLVVGQGPRMAGLDPIAATLRWEVPLGSPRGANEVERLADLIGPVVRSGDLLCARSFQAAVGCVDAQLGNVAWTKTVGGTDAIAGDGELLFGADASDRLSAWRTATGDVAWTSEALMFRGVGAPAAVGQSVVFGDSNGTLHWLSRAKGEAQARVPTDGSAILTPPVSVGGVLVVVTRGGGVFAFRPA